MKAAGKRYIWHRSRSDAFRLWNLSDLHWMNKGCAENDIRRDIKAISDDPFSFWFGGGDFCDFIGYRDKRFDPDCVADWVPLKELADLGRYGMTQMRDLLMPIKHKCLGLLLGNHEQRYQLATEHESLHSWLCTELDVPNLTYSCLFDLIFVRTPKVPADMPKLMPNLPEKQSGPRSDKSVAFRIFAHHGAGYACTPGGKLNKLIQFIQSFEADCYFIGHVHDKLARREPILRLDDSGTRIVQRDRLGLIAGSYLKTYTQNITSYGEMRGYRPTSLGAAMATLIPDSHTMMAEV